MDQIEEIKRKVEISLVIGEYVELKKSGRNYKGLCPFHGEKTPSFMVNEELKLFKCFGCGASGDVIKFLMDIEGIEFLEALEKLAARVGVKLIRKKGEGRSERMKLFDICSMALEYYNFLLSKHDVGKRARDYLKERGVSEKIIETFKLGYSLDGWDGVYKFLCKKKGFDELLVEKAGLIIKGSYGYYDRFRDRVMFPFYDNTGRVVGFSGRVLPSDSVGKPGYVGESGKSYDSIAKYINSPETPIYHKSDVLFGLKQAKQFVREKKRVILVEGPMDMISSFAAGIGETVASNGTAVTVEMIKIISRLGESILIALDADDAGYSAIKRTVELAENQDLSIKVVIIEGGKDPDDMARNNPKGWKMAVNKAVPVYEFVMNRAFEKFGKNGAEAASKVSREVLPFLAKISNKVVLGHWMKKLSIELNVDEASVWEELEKYRRKGNFEVPAKKDVKDESRSRLFELGLSLVGLLFEASDKEREDVRKKLAGIRFGKPWSGAIKMALDKNVKFSERLGEADDEESKILQEAYIADVDRSDLKLLEMALEFKHEWIVLRKKELVEEIKLCEKKGMKEEMKKLVEEFMALG
jgi:DNA primase